MKKKVFSLVLVISMSALSGFAQKNNVFVSDEGRFNVTPPVGFERLKYEKHTHQTESGDLEMHQYSFTLDRGTSLISYYDLPDRVFQTKSSDLIFSDSVAALLRGGETTISNQKNIMVDGYPAISFDLRMVGVNGSLYTHAVMAIAKPRAYSYLFMSADQTQLAKLDVLNFFRSFHIQK